MSSILGKLRTHGEMGKSLDGRGSHYCHNTHKLDVKEAEFIRVLLVLACVGAVVFVRHRQQTATACH